MDTKHSLALKKKRELLGSISKRKMSLRKNIDNMKQNECRLDITQITKCVFLGSLCLKPVPHLFDSPLLLEELDMKVGNVRSDPPANKVNNENINSGTRSLNNPKGNSTKNLVKKAVKQKCSPKVKKKSLRERNDVKITSNEVNKIIQSENLPVEPKEPTKVNVIKSVPTAKKSGDIIDCLPQKTATKNKAITTSQIPHEVNIISTEPAVNDVEMAAIEASPTEKLKRNIKEDIFVDEEILDLKVFSENIEEETQISNESRENRMSPDIKVIDEIALHYEDIERLKREPTPEIILSDSDEDAIDQLMYNIMDIKVGPGDFGKDFFEMPSSDIEQYEEEYSHEVKETTALPVQDDSPPKEQKYLKRHPQCKICSRVFSNYIQLKRHKESHNGDRPYVCLKCNENHTSLDQLIAHLRTHQGKRPYVCKKCNEGFRTMKALENHQPVHVLRKATPQKKTYRCEVCAKEFRKLCDLERHTRVHTGEKPSVCNICNRRFQQAHNLNKHLLIHTKEKPFECDICNKRFGRNDVLNRHLLTHSVNKPNQCETCMKSFIRVSQLLAHKVKYHEKGAS